MSDLNRREFVIAAAATMCAASACMMCGATAEAAEEAATKVDVGTAADYAKDGVYDKFANEKKVIVVREGTKIYAMTAICTHKLGIVTLNCAELMCPKHKSYFAKDGKPTKGPAKAALFRHAISTNADGHIIVDTSKKFGENQWTEAAAFIEVK